MSNQDEYSVQAQLDKQTLEAMFGDVFATLALVRRGQFDFQALPDETPEQTAERTGKLAATAILALKPAEKQELQRLAVGIVQNLLGKFGMNATYKVTPVEKSRIILLTKGGDA